jgi:hypothetical protein
MNDDFEQIFGMSQETWVARVADGIEEDEHLPRKEAEAAARKILRQQWPPREIGIVCRDDAELLAPIPDDPSRYAFVDPPWVFGIPGPAAPKETVDAWFAEVADDVQKSDGEYTRAKAEASAWGMLKREWEWSSLRFNPRSLGRFLEAWTGFRSQGWALRWGAIDPSAYGAEQWVAGLAADLETEERISSVQAEELARRILQIELRQHRDPHRVIGGRRYVVERPWLDVMPTPRSTCRRRRMGRFFLSPVRTMPAGG